MRRSVEIIQGFTKYIYPPDYTVPFNSSVLSLQLISFMLPVRDAPFDIWGGGLEKKKINLCRHVSQEKKVC